MKREIPIFITIAIGIFLTVSYFLNEPFIGWLGEEFTNWGVLIEAMAYILGLANLYRINWRSFIQKRKDWPYKGVLLLALTIAFFLPLYERIVWGTMDAGTKSDWIFKWLLTPLSATMFSLLAFFIASAAFRAFRAKSVDAFLLLLAGTIVMIGRVPLGRAISEVFPLIENWLMAVPNAAGQRAIIIGAAMGAIATGLRIIFGIERAYLSGE